MAVYDMNLILVGYDSEQKDDISYSQIGNTLPM